MELLSEGGVIGYIWVKAVRSHYQGNTWHDGQWTPADETVWVGVNVPCREEKRPLGVSEYAQITRRIYA